MRNPQFNQMRAGMDGFSPCDGRPSEENIQAFMHFLCRPIEEAREGELNSWDDALAFAYAQLSFFRVYYCGEDQRQMPKFLKQYARAYEKGIDDRARP